MQVSTDNLQASDFGKVALLMGGWSAERDISLKSGRQVFQSLQKSLIDVTAIDVDRDISKVLLEGNYDRVFNILHGRGGEDGSIQGVLEVLGLPYTGSGICSSALAMHKVQTKNIWLNFQLPTPSYVLIRYEQDCSDAIEKLGFPLIVKPVFEGSSIGITKVNTKDEMYAAWTFAKQYGQVMAEQWVDGNEYTASILGDQVLPLIKLKTEHDFYNYDAKYTDITTEYLCPCGLSTVEEDRLKKMSMDAFLSIGAYGWGRVDFILDANKKPWLIELNTVPGMTDHSLVPMAAKQANIEFDDLVINILKTSFKG